MEHFFKVLFFFQSNKMSKRIKEENEYPSELTYNIMEPVKTFLNSSSATNSKSNQTPKPKTIQIPQYLSMKQEKKVK